MIDRIEAFLALHFTQDAVNQLTMLLPLLFLLVGMIFAILADSYISKQHRRILLVIVALAVSLIAQNYLEDLLASGIPRPFQRTVVAVYGYCVRPVFLVLFCYVVDPGRRHLIAWIMIGVNAAVYMTALFGSGLSFYIVGNSFRRGPLNDCCLIVSILLLAYLLFLTVRKYGRVRKWERVILAFVILIILAALFLDGNVGNQQQPVSFLTVSLVCSCVLYYIWLHLQFVREHEQALMAEHRIEIMMSQIQPHFLYNTLSTIQSLCRSDPEKAFAVTEKFGAYLRQNIDSLDQPNLIPLDKELEHTRIYAEIEMVRFPNVRVEYDVEDGGFSLPALTIQPLVENAIRHGVRGRKDGLVTVSTRRMGGYHEIVIRDNGKGFSAADPKAPRGADGTHIGIRNVRDRLEKMCGGLLTVDSRAGEGTKATILIPFTHARDRAGEAEVTE